MFDAPKLKENNVMNEQFAGVTYHLQGELVPALTIELDGKQKVYFEHHVLLWKSADIDIKIKSVKGAVKRMFAGINIFVTEAQGTGQVAFSRDGAGHIIPIHLEKGQEIDVREHQFLAATANVEYTFSRVKGVANFFGGSGFFIDKFIAKDDTGIVWLHGYGNIFEKVLAEGEVIDVEPGAWVYKEPSVKLDTIMPKLSTGLIGSTRLTFNRFTGPGRVGIQSMSLLDLISND